MNTLTETASITLNASAVALAWTNAFHATSQAEERPLLFRTLSVELYATGVQFIATNGHVLFRTWVPTMDEKGTAHAWPELEEAPLATVLVGDAQHFALNFIRALAGAAKQFDAGELTMSVEDAPLPDIDTPAPLGDVFSPQVLTLRAFGQQMHCQLIDGVYPNWRALKFGIDDAERVDGMLVSTALLATIGKLKGVLGIELTFTGDETRINLQGMGDTFRGLLMPMRRLDLERKSKPDADEEQLDHTDHYEYRQGEDGVDGATVKLNGEWVPATEENMRKAARPAIEHAFRKARGKV